MSGGAAVEAIVEIVQDGNIEPTSSDVPSASSPMPELPASAHLEPECQPKIFDVSDPYAYIVRDSYTSEIFKIEINNLPKRFGIGELRKRLLSLGLKPKKVKAMESSRYAFVTFACAEDKDVALSALNGYVWKGFTLTAKGANPAADPLIKKRKLTLGAAGVETSSMPAAKKECTGNAADGDQKLAEQLCNAVIPLWKMNYVEQLEFKQKEMTRFLDSLGHQVQKCYRDAYVPRHLITDDFKYSSRLGTIKPSPVIDGYRNKCEFTVGRHPISDECVVGFRLSDYKSGSCAVMEPVNCKHIPPQSLAVAQAFQAFVRQSNYGPFDPVTKKGNWRCLMVRTCRSGDVMACISFVVGDTAEEELLSAKMMLKEYFGPHTDGGGVDISSVKLSSLYFMPEHTRKDDATGCAPELLLGKQFIIEDLSSKKFRVSPDSFLQVNTDAAEVLYELVGEWCRIQHSTTVLDVCCGTGTIGLTLAQAVSRVVGIEMVAQAVDDARSNADLNGAANVEFICGKAEDVLPGILHRFTDSSSRAADVVAVVDPPRAGLHSSVIQAIRRNMRLQRLVYVSCSPTTALPNFLDLLRPESRRMRGAAFSLVRAVPVDLFPHTSHCELVLLFERAPAAAKASGDNLTASAHADGPVSGLASCEAGSAGAAAEASKDGSVTGEAPAVHIEHVESVVNISPIANDQGTNVADAASIDFLLPA